MTKRVSQATCRVENVPYVCPHTKQRDNKQTKPLIKSWAKDRIGL